MFTICLLSFSLLFLYRVLGLLGRHLVCSLGVHHLAEKNPMVTAQQCIMIEIYVHTVASESGVGAGVGVGKHMESPQERRL